MRPGAFRHAGVGQALDWVDSRVQRGEKVLPPLLLALMFGEYLEEKEERLRQGGTHAQQAVDLAVAELMQEFSATVLVPGKAAIILRHILGYQHRFRKTPGRHASSFVRRPGFADAFAYLCIRGELTGEDLKLCEWWKKYLRENPPGAPAEPSGEETGNPPAAKRRRRRRKRRRGGETGENAP